MPSAQRESQAPQDVATQITVGRWLVKASAGLSEARAGRTPQESERQALETLRDALRSAAAHKSIVAISSQLGLVSDRETDYLVEAVGQDAVPALSEMADALSRASEGHLDERDTAVVERVRQLLLALSELRLAQARHVDRSDQAEPRWPTTLSSSS